MIPQHLEDYQLLEDSLSPDLCVEGGGKIESLAQKMAYSSQKLKFTPILPVYIYCM